MDTGTTTDTFYEKAHFDANLFAENLVKDIPELEFVVINFGWQFESDQLPKAVIVSADQENASSPMALMKYFTTLTTLAKELAIRVAKVATIEKAQKMQLIETLAEQQDALNKATECCGDPESGCTDCPDGKSLAQ